MGLEEFIVRRKVGQALKKGGPMLDWLKAHKALVGVLFTGIGAALAYSPDPRAQTAYHWMTVIGPTLIGAGVLPADVHVKQAQEFEANGGVDLRKVQ